MSSNEFVFRSEHHCPDGFELGDWTHCPQSIFCLKREACIKLYVNLKNAEINDD
jgi:hypothetical protein